MRVLIINRKLNFSIRIKQALEQTGEFEVASFTTASAALDVLVQSPYDVVLIDFELPGQSPADLVQRLRAIQPDIAIVASPETDTVADQVQAMGLNGIVDVPCTARELVPVLHAAMGNDVEPITDLETPVSADRETDEIQPAFSSLNSVLVRLGGLEITNSTETLDVDMTGAEYEGGATIEFVLTGEFNALKESFDRPQARPKDAEAEQAVDIFHQLAAEEPPMPTLEETGTVSDLRTGIGDLNGVAAALRHDQETPPELDTLDDDDDDNTARHVLESAQDDTSPIVHSLEALVKSIGAQFPDADLGIKPLPSWLDELERYIREPDFLERVRQARTEARENPPEAELPPYPFAESVDAVEPDGEVLPPPTLPEEPVAPTDDAAVGDPVLANLALSLTQAALESTADAVLLARDGEILSVAGTMPPEDIGALRQEINDDWEADPDEARIRFVTLKTSGQDFMLYSRQTEEGLTLTMIFAGTVPLRVIRRQSNRILDALWSVEVKKPESPSLLEELEALEQEAEKQEESARESTSQIEAIMDEAYSGPLDEHTYLWLVRDPDQTLAEPHTVRDELKAQLDRMGWRVNNIDVAEDYVYLVLGVPADMLAQDALSDLRLRAGRIAQRVDSRLQADRLWSDSYAVLIPGREMDTEEIQRYINFGRMQ